MCSCVLVHGRAGSTGMWAWECKSILICRNPERLYHSLDLKLKGASEYIGTNNSKPLLIYSCPPIFQLHTYDTDSRVLSMLMKTSYTISNKHQPSLLRSWCWRRVKMSGLVAQLMQGKKTNQQNIMPLFLQQYSLLEKYHISIIFRFMQNCRNKR